MKKTLVALAVLAAGSVNAAEVYNNDGISTTVSGVAEVQLIANKGDDSGAFTDADLNVRIDDFDLTLATSIALSEDVAAVGAVSINDDVSADRTYVGFSSAEMGTITFGQQTTIMDDSGNDASFEFGGELFGATFNDGPDVIKYVYDNGQVFFAIAHDLEESTGEATTTDGRLGFRSEAIEIALYASDYEFGTTEETAMNIQATYSMDALALNASYGTVDDGADTTTYIQANVAYTVDAMTYALGVSSGESDADGADAVNGVYVNVVNQLATNVRVYAEVGMTDYDADTRTVDGVAYDAEDFGYLAGMEVKF